MFGLMALFEYVEMTDTKFILPGTASFKQSFSTMNKEISPLEIVLPTSTIPNSPT